MLRLCRLTLVVCSLVANITSNFSNSLANTCCFSNLQLEGSPFAMALWAAGEAPEKRSACSQECLERKIKNNFSGPRKSCFFLICNWKGFPLQWRSGQLEKHLKSLVPAPRSVWKGNYTSVDPKQFTVSKFRLKPVSLIAECFCCRCGHTKQHPPPI